MKRSHHDNREAVLLAISDELSVVGLNEAAEDLGVQVLRPDRPDALIEQLETVPVRLAVTDLKAMDGKGGAICKRIKESRSARLVHLLLLTESDEVDTVLERYGRFLDDILIVPASSGLLRYRLRMGLQAGRLKADHAGVTRRLDILAEMANIAHRINNPLTSIVGEVALLREEVDELPPLCQKQEIADSIEAIDRESRRISEIVREVQFARQQLREGF